jgi:hypothetical protein
MMQVDALPDDLLETARDFSLRVAGRVQRERGLVFLGEFKRGLERENGQYTRKGGTKIRGQGLDYLVPLAPE